MGQPKPDARTPSRNTRSLVLFGRSVVITLSVLSAGLGFLVGARMSDYDPHSYAAGAAVLFCLACILIAVLLMRRRAAKDKIRRLEMRLEELSDRNWELSEAEVRARSLLDAQGDLIVRRNVQGLTTYVNDAYCALARTSREQLIGRRSALVVLEQGATEVLDDGTRAHDQKIDSSPAPRWIAWREVAVRTETGSEIQGVGRDVTDRVEAERAFARARDLAEAANHAKSHFLATVSHEIRTPLNGLLGMADLLLDTPLTPEQLTYAKAAKTSGETLLSLIADVLDFSKIEAGKLDLEPRPFSLVSLVEEAVELMAPRAQNKDSGKGIEIASFVDDRLADIVIGDAARLRQVLLNLVGNAVKFTEHGGVAVIVEPGKDIHHIRFTVRDTGIGLAPQDQARIFLDFEQADGSSTRKFSGTGLGLAISRRIVERMGGTITLDSAPGKGARFGFEIALPRSAVDAGTVAFARPDLSGSAVLIAATVDIEASLLARRLGNWGARAHIAASETAARVLLTEQRWGALLVDLPVAKEMIAKGGFPADAIANRIVLVSPGDRHELPALKAAGFTGYLVKPVRAASLAARLRAQNPFEHELAESVEEINHDSTTTTNAGLSILVAEDNEINALLARALLTRLGHRPTVATDGEAAVAAWLAARGANVRYDLVLMDVQMPGIDGLEATRRIRAAEAEERDQHDSTFKPTRIIALTANTNAEDRDACLAAGMDALLVKPLNRERLLEALEATTRTSPLAA